MGGADKPTLPVGGQSMLTRVLAAVHDAEPRIVVGPVPPDLPVPVHSTREDPPGGGPVAATSAGLALVPPEVTFTALLAADLPLLTGEAIDVLRLTVESAPMQGAVYPGADGRPQMLCGGSGRAPADVVRGMAYGGAACGGGPAAGRTRWAARGFGSRADGVSEGGR